MRGNLASLGALGALVALVALLVVVPMISVFGAASGSRSADSGADAKARMKDAQGDFVGWVYLDATKGGKVEVRAKVRDIVPHGQFHGFHLHTTGKCDPKAVDPKTDKVVPFLSAGAHFNPTDEDHGEHAGDLSVLLVMKNGQAKEELKTDRFRLSQLFDDDGTAVIIHEGRDNYANIPAETPDGEERYHSHLENVFGPDSVTKATGDAGNRFACGVVKRT
jgi:superoxide dismutase, Cu-Zn family